MNTRLNFWEKGQQAMHAMFALGKHLSKSTLSPELRHLISYRVSQINGCAFCLDMHAKDLLALDENPQRLLVLSAWREAPFYSEKERAALAFTEALVLLADGMIPEAVYEQASAHFTEAELIDLAIVVVATGGWNRINIAFGADTGSYQVGMYH
ncbi:carboxymuconolactone decarboxylase family protein [Flavobacterium sp.]|uniref:carboxymuconolactone decarboxylase family protein n=1 Tax=Flavobacterium sp. TaxID=239 RepID=UPI0039E57CAA